MPTQDEIARKIHERYPDLEAIYKPIPELWNILVLSATNMSAGGAGLSQSQFEAAVRNTNWYKQSTEKGRDWFFLRIQNPAEARKRQEQAQHNVLLAGIDMGANLSMQQVGYIADLWLQNGWSTAEMRDQIIGYTSKLPAAKRAPGQFGAAITKVKQIADDYAMPVSDKEAAGFAQQLLFQGTGGDTAGRDEASLRDVFAQRARSLYPSLRKELEAGVTVKQWAQPFFQVAAQELGVSPDAITFNDPKWQALLEGQKSKDGTTSDPYSLAQWQTKLRTDARYGYDQTNNARLNAAGLAQGLAQMFGNAG